MHVNLSIFNRLLLLAAPLLLACKKDEANPDTTGIRLFTNKMEITDVAVKTKFLSRASASFRQAPPASTTEQVKFSAPDTATFGTSTLKYVVTKNNAQYVFRSQGGVLLSNGTLLLRDMLKYTAPIYAYPTASGVGYSTSEVRVGYDKGNQLALSYLQYYWLQSTFGYSGRYSGTLFNELDDNVAAKVGPTDTLAIRTGSLSAALLR
jgi:hypothetical protein